MISKVITAAVRGISAMRIQVETDISKGLPQVTVVGLGDTSVKESRDRIRAAVVNCGFQFPSARVTVNLSPAYLRKKGSHFDLAIAVGILASSGQVFDRKLSDIGFMGELSLSGDVKGCDGILPMIMELRKTGVGGAVIPFENAGEAALFDDMDIYPVKTLAEAAEVLNLERTPERGGMPEKGRIPYKGRKPEKAAGSGETAEKEFTECENPGDFGDVKGQEQAKRAIMIAVAGGHGILMTGSPATGKTMLSSRIPDIMMPMDREEILETTAIYSIAGLLKPGSKGVMRRPFRSPAAGISKAGLIGGGYPPVPGEITLAHRGVLFLDEVGEYDRDVLDSLRIPLEKKQVTLVRRGEKYVFPADCLLVAASNPCKCGYYGDGSGRCTCTEEEIRRYRGKLSGPIIDRIDMHIYLYPVNYEALGERDGVTTAQMREKIRRAWLIQKERYKGTDVRLNAGLTEKEAAKICRADDEGEELLRSAYERLKLNPRTVFKVRKIARTVADVEGEEFIKSVHVAEALQYRERA